MNHLPATLQKQIVELRQRKHRERLGLFVIEGKSQVVEALQGHTHLEYVVVSHGDWSFDSAVPVYLEEAQQLQRLSELQTSPEILAVARIPQRSFTDFNLSEPIIYLDGVADPGNLGTMLRTGEWFGITQWLLGPGTVDPYNQKVVRAAMGSLTRVSLVLTEQPEEQLLFLQKQGYALVAAVPEGGGVSVSDGHVCLMFGSEAHGIQESLIRLADQTYSIPRYGETESLNVAVAFGITLYSLKNK